jgi:hypothetical protein
MPRLSLWRPNKGNDYKFFDRRMSEMFTIGGTDVNIHKYLGPISDGTSTSATEPGFLNDSVKNIQDLLFLENRDRKYDTSIYTLRSIYRMNDNDFDLTQFGLFLTGDTMFMVFHLNDMIETIGRKIMVGDVMELPHLKDYYPLDEDIPAALKRYYVVQDATRAAEGFAPTWYPHLWRVKLAPLVDSQEYKDILNQIKVDTNGDGTDDTPIGDLISTLDKYLAINDAIIARAEDDVPASGYDTSFIYTAPVNENGYPGDPNGLDASTVSEDASESITDTTAGTVVPSAKVQGYLTSDGLPPNGASVAAGISFPASPTTNDFFLRLDYVPNRLFRYDGRRWIKVEDAVRTSLTLGSDNKSQRSGFVNNTDASYKNPLGWDAIRVASPYTPLANAYTSSFTLSSKTIVTKATYSSLYGAKTYINGTSVPTTISNSSGNVALTISSGYPVVVNDIVEYTVYANVIQQRQSLSDALRPTADN